MKKTLCLKMRLRAVLLVLLLSVVELGKGYSQDFTVGDLNYSVNEDGVSVTVTGHVDGLFASGALTIPSTVAYGEQSFVVSVIGHDAFNNCRELTAVSLPNTVTTIESYAFLSCTGLTTITLSNTLTTIDTLAFKSCGLTSILAIIPPSLGNYVFAHVPCSTLVVPCGCATAYGTSTWYDNFPNIVEDCTTVSEDNENTVSIYPNPTYGAISIEAEGLQHINVYTILGQLVESRQADGEVFELDLSSHEAGIYLIRIETASGIATKRVALTK